MECKLAALMNKFSIDNARAPTVPQPRLKAQMPPILQRTVPHDRLTPNDHNEPPSRETVLASNNPPRQLGNHLGRRANHRRTVHAKRRKSFALAPRACAKRHRPRCFREAQAFTIRLANLLSLWLAATRELSSTPMQRSIPELPWLSLVARAEHPSSAG